MDRKTYIITFCYNGSKDWASVDSRAVIAPSPLDKKHEYELVWTALCDELEPDEIKDIYESDAYFITCADDISGDILEWKGLEC